MRHLILLALLAASDDSGGAAGGSSPVPWAGRTAAIDSRVGVKCDAGMFSEGLAAILVDRRWGFIDPQGQTVIKPQYDEARGFHDGWARVTLNGEICYIDRKGKVVLRPKYGAFWGFLEGLTPVMSSPEHA